MFAANPRDAVRDKMLIAHTPMIVHINGEPRTFSHSAPDQLTLAELIESLAMKPDRVAVELNLEIVPRDRWSETRLKDGDRLEIVHFVGGGGPL